MKKTLIALAVLAASGASFAQVTITGNLTMGYQAATTHITAANGALGGVASDSSGFGVDTSQIDFAATEDLGGGMKAVAKMSLAGADRSGESNGTTAGGVTGRDASLAMYTNVGVFALGSTSSADYLSGGIAGVGAYYSGWNGKITSARSRRDTASFILPMNAFTLTLSYQEQGDTQGLGNGSSGNNSATSPVTNLVGQTLQVIALNYNKGPLVLDGQFLNFLSSNSGNQTFAGATAPLAKTQVRLSGSYDLGMVKFGLGHVVTTSDNGVNPNPKTYDTQASAAVPLGSLTLGATYITRRADDQSTAQGGVAANGTRNGWSLQAAYALSKRTALIGNYARWDGSVGNTTQANQTQVLLSHSF